jgi:6,7-dimethyl-8-ribityllumazine synthase
MSTHAPQAGQWNVPQDARFAIVAARFNGQIVDELINGCRSRLTALGVAENRVELHRVPGAFELPVAAKKLAISGKFSAVICLGAVIRGDTPHFDYVAGEAARGIQQVAIETTVPIIFGVLTTNTEEQARERIDRNSKHGHAGERAAEAAVEMVALAAAI